MKFNLIQWLFTDPCSAGGGPASGNADCPNPEPFHFWALWIVICAVLLVAWVYYQAEGRRTIFGNHALNKSIFDRMLNAFAIIGLVGFMIMFFRWAADSSLFAWRFWRYAWLVWLAAVTVRWGVYFIFKYKAELDSYRAYRTHQKYVPQPKTKRAARAGSR